MPLPIRIRVGELQLRGELGDSPCARAIGALLPLRASFQVWGDELYFPVPVEEGLDQTATTDVRVGDLAYWPQGNALCIFFGPTPVSPAEEPVAAGPVNIVGSVEDATRLRRAKGEGRIVVEAA